MRAVTPGTDARRPAGRPRAAWPAVAAVLVGLVMAGCTLQLQTPKLEVTTEPAYSSRDVLIPYQLRGDGTFAQARWSLRRYRGDGEWELERSWDIRVPNGSSGILELNLDDGKYELTAELLTSRGGVSASAPSLTRQAEFYVDTRPPFAGINIPDNQGGGPYSAAISLEVYPEYSEPPDLDVETDVHLYHKVNSTSPPTAEQDPTGPTIVVWPGGAPFYSRVLTIIAIDEAGNVGSYLVRSYTGS